MPTLAHHPFLLLVVSFLVLWLWAWIGALMSRRVRPDIDSQREDFSVVQGATLTLLALITGFTFSMALTRYDQRKTYEEEEANAIGTEYARAGLLPRADAENVRALLVTYLQQRISFYTTRDDAELERIDARTAKLQNDLWSAVETPAKAQPTPVTALAVAGMNDVLNSQGYTQSAWLNLIPRGAWDLLAAIAICSTTLVGIGARESNVRRGLFVVLPLVLSIAFFLIADIDSPRRGIIRVFPQNLDLLLQSLTGR
jgi:hypothetical protein